MNWQTLTRLHSTLTPLKKFLIIFSFCAVAAIGIILACADSDEHEYSVFSPEYFVSKEYSPFFYTGEEVYYGQGYGPTTNDQYNSIIVDEWYQHYGKRVKDGTLSYLLLLISEKGIDSVERRIPGNTDKTNAAIEMTRLSNAERSKFFNYLKIAKECEKFAVYADHAWYYDTVKKQHSPFTVGQRVLKAFQAEDDTFIKERLWFQLVRYYYFSANATENSNTVKVFESYKNTFPKNVIYYRTMGYVAGYYYSRKNYAMANYLYSLCFNSSQEQKIPAHWSFHPQEEKDWNETLKLAKTPQEKINLWQMLGMWYDEGRAIKEIYAINPKSDKMDILLSRLVNGQEGGGGDFTANPAATSMLTSAHADNKMVQAIALKGNTSKPYYWNLAAGYLAYRDSNYTAAAKFYAAAKKTFPKNDLMIQAQSRMLDILLTVSRLKTITPQAEDQLTASLNWLADLRDSKIKITNLRFNDAMNSCRSILSKRYDSKGNYIKSLCLYENDQDVAYTDSNKVKAFIRFLEKPVKTPYEKAITRYYPYNANPLYYHLAIQKVYLQQTKAAIAYLKKRTVKDSALAANPFNGRLVDCHDCDFDAPQKQKFTPLKFLQTLDTIQTRIKQHKDVYRNAMLAGNAYYNITYYGNGRQFYNNDVFSGNFYGYTQLDSLDDVFQSMDIARKFYLIARNNAATAEQKAHCTFMLSKCAHNDFFYPKDTWSYAEYKPLTDSDTMNAEPLSYPGLFKELKDKYNKTAFYKEALRECGYFRDYVNPAPKKKK